MTIPSTNVLLSQISNGEFGYSVPYKLSDLYSISDTPFSLATPYGPNWHNITMGPAGNQSYASLIAYGYYYNGNQNFSMGDWKGYNQNATFMVRLEMDATQVTDAGDYVTYDIYLEYDSAGGPNYELIRSNTLYGGNTDNADYFLTNSALSYVDYRIFIGTMTANTSSSGSLALNISSITTNDIDTGGVWGAYSSRAYNTAYTPNYDILNNPISSDWIVNDGGGSYITCTRRTLLRMEFKY